MKTRTITGIVMALVFIPLLIIPQLLIPFHIVMGAAAVIAAIEMIKMFEKEKAFSRETKIVTIVLTLCLFLITAWFTTKSETVEIINFIGPKFISATFMIVIMTLLLLIYEKDFNGGDVGKILTIVFYVGLGTASIVVLRVLGLRFITYLLLTTVLTDVFAYIFGIKFGKHKMAPNISPKKSWEGAIAGTVISTIVAGSFGLFYGKLFTGGIFNPEGYATLLSGIEGLDKLNSVGQGLVIYSLTLLLSVIGQLGDLVASKFKRTYEIKDFGNIFPGHGGIIDRFDSAFLAAMFLVGFLTLLTTTGIF